MMSWQQFVYGWPTIILALAAFGVAFARRRSWLGFAGVALAVPFLWYASGAPRGSFFSPAIFITLAAAAWLIRQGRRRLAAVCVAPFVMVVAMLALAVVTQW